MFEKFRLQEVLVKYKQSFVSSQWGNEKYKWEAVKFFQDNWDVNAANFVAMLTLSLSKTYNLLASMNNFPARMIEKFAETAPEEVRAMFIALFDESKDVVIRITEFKDQSSILLEKYGIGQRESEIGEKVPYAAAALGNDKLGVRQVYGESLSIEGDPKGLGDDDGAHGADETHSIRYRCISFRGDGHHSCQEKEGEGRCEKHLPAEKKQDK